MAADDWLDADGIRWGVFEDDTRDAPARELEANEDLGMHAERLEVDAAAAADRNAGSGMGAAGMVADAVAANTDTTDDAAFEDTVDVARKSEASELHGAADSLTGAADVGVVIATAVDSAARVVGDLDEVECVEAAADVDDCWHNVTAAAAGDSAWRIVHTEARPWHPDDTEEAVVASVPARAMDDSCWNCRSTVAPKRTLALLLMPRSPKELVRAQW